MPISIDDTFKEAAEKGSWIKAMVCTEMLLVEEGRVVICHPPQACYRYESYKYNLEILLKYPNDDSHYCTVVEALQKYVNDFEERAS